MIRKFISRYTNIRGGGRNLPSFSRWVLSIIQCYNQKKYWKRRAYVIDPKSSKPLLLRLYYLIYIKRIDAKHNCSFGTGFGYGAKFKTPPNLPHGPNGIIMGNDTVIGSNCTIFHQVTISHGNVVIGDNVILGAGAKVLPDVTIGNDCKVGANAVVVESLPNGATCVMQKPRIISKTNVVTR